MKYEWKTGDEKCGILEEEMEKARQEYVKELEYKKSGAEKWLRYIKLIILLILMLFFGWSLYVVFQTYHSRVTENEVTDIILEKYSPVFESQKFEAEKSHSNTEMSVIFVKPEVIMDKLNNFLGDIKLIKEQDSMQDEAVAMDMHVTVHTSTQNPISIESDDIVRIDSGSKSNEDLNHVEKSTKNVMPWKVFSTGYIDEIIIDKVPTHNKYHSIVEKLLDIAKMNVALEEYDNKNDEDTNRLTLNNQEKHVLDASNKLESLISDATTISSLEDSIDRKTNVNPNYKTYSLQDLMQKHIDSIKDAEQDNHSESSSFSDEQVNKQVDEQVNADSESEFVICPPYQSYEDSDVSLKDVTKESSISQPVSAPKISEQIENQSSDDVDAKNENKHDVDDSNISIEDSDIWLPLLNMQHTTSNPWMKDSYEFLLPHLKVRDSVESSQSNIDENNVPIRDPYEFLFPHLKIGDSVESSQSNIDDSYVSIKDHIELRLPQSKMQDSVESSKSNIDESNVSIRDPYEFLFPLLKIRDNIESSQSNIDDSNVSIRDPYEFLLPQSKMQDNVESSKSNIDDMPIKNLTELWLSQSKMQDSVESSQSNIDESNVPIRDPYEFLFPHLKIRDSIESSQSNIDESNVPIRDPYEFLFPHLKIRDSVESSQSNIDESNMSIRDPYEFLVPHLKVRDSVKSSQSNINESNVSIKDPIELRLPRSKMQDSVESSKSNIDDSNVSIRDPYKSWFLQLKMQDSVESSKSNIDDNNMSLKDSSELWFPHLKMQDNVESTKSNIDNRNMPIIILSFPQSDMQDSIESSTPNVNEFQWFNAPARFADDLQTGSVDISKSNKTQISSFGDTNDDTDEEYFIPKNKCKIQIENYLLKVTCSDIGFDEKWNLTSSEMLTGDASEDVSADYIKSNEKSTMKVENEPISTENSNEKVATSQDGVPEVVDAIKLQEITSSAKTLNNDILDLSEMEKSDSFDIIRVNQDDANSPNKEEIKRTFIFTFEPNSDNIDSDEGWDSWLETSDTQQKQLKNMEEQDYSDYKDLETSSEVNERIYTLDKELTSMLVDELRQYLSRNDDYMNNICIKHPYLHIHCTYPHSSLWDERYEALKKYLQYLRNRVLLTDNHRKKRMADDLTMQQEQVSNVLDDNKLKLKNLLENLKNLYQKMEILAACIDELHKQYLLHNKLEDNYISSEFPMEVGESQKIYIRIYKR